MGWVTPLGSGLKEVWNRLETGDQPPRGNLVDPAGRKPYLAYRVPQNALNDLPPHPRLRRSSAISKFAAAAGLAALQDAGLSANDLASARMALIFAVANGGVIYTKRFYSDIVSIGAEAASPLLFPETVFNAAASHLAAIIGLSGATYTVVGDGAVGLTAIQMAQDLLASGSVDLCLVVAAEEADWLLCDAYHRWRLLRRDPPLRVFGSANQGTILSEGGGALLLTNNSGAVRVAAITAGRCFSARKEAAAVLAASLREVGATQDAAVIGSANGTFIDTAELQALREVCPNAVIYEPKTALGEGIAASALWQMIVAALALKVGRLPQTRELSQPDIENAQSVNRGIDQTIVLSCGLNQQAGATRLVLSVASPPASSG
jgi:3-oxoacyl-(acyl-carrier-protein) synthase